MSQKLAAVKGMNDLLPEEIGIWQHVEAAAREIFSRYGYAEVRTPVLEDTSLFERSVGEATDIVGKEMYTFHDKAGRSVSLRPEGTAPAVRAYVEHAVAQKEPLTRWYYIGPMFRYERMKTGRYRQFHQIGVEAFGAKEPAQDVEVMEMVVHFLNALELSGVALHLNSLGDEACRPEHQKRLVAYLSAHREELCPDCQTRLERNPLRVLDCKNESCRAIAQGAPKVQDSLCEACRQHLAEVRRRLDLLGVRYELDPSMVRGLDYYTRTAFEFVADDPALGTASAVGGGGRYDRLVRELGGPDVPAVGVALGLDRICLLLGAAGKRFGVRPDLFVAFVDVQAQDEAMRLSSALRRAGLRVELDTRGGSLKSQMKRADKSGARFALVLGEKELADRAGELRPMAGGEPRRVAFSELSAVLRRA
ncbi:MAG: histidine--tRNA ligase [Myxococcales bacterium]|nr:histidine--tRNA ligase [Myxococcales bacterium]